SAPSLYTAGCSNAAVTCSGTVRQAKNPLTGQLLGTGSSVLIGTIVPNSGNVLNGIAQAGQGVDKTAYTSPSVGYAPRFGAACELVRDAVVGHAGWQCTADGQSPILQGIRRHYHAARHRLEPVPLNPGFIPAAIQPGDFLRVQRCDRAGEREPHCTTAPAQR